MPVPAGQQVEFKPGELHLMLVGLKEDQAVGDRVQITLQFKVAGKVIRSLSQRAGRSSQLVW